MQRRWSELRSVSEGDLESIAKRMISGALKDVDRMAKLHRAIYEGLYFQAMREFGSCKIRDNSANISCRKNCSRPKTPKVDDRAINSRADSNRNKRKKYPRPGDRTGDQMSANSVVKNRALGVEKREDREKPLDSVRERNQLTFEIWKREKAKARRRMLKEERDKRQRELDAQWNEFERRRAHHETYMSRKKKQFSQRRIARGRKKVATRNVSPETQAGQTSEKASVIGEDFGARKSRGGDRSEDQRAPQRKTRCLEDYGEFQFDAWLDQLDSVLQQKYTREGRHRVHPFYRRPSYYGTAC